MNLYRELRIAPSIISSLDFQLAYTNNLSNDIFDFKGECMRTFSLFF